MNKYEIVMKLIGEVIPVGEQHTDDERFENLKDLIALAKDINELLVDIAKEERNAPEASRHRAGHTAYCYLRNQLGEELRGIVRGTK